MTVFCTICGNQNYNLKNTAPWITLIINEQKDHSWDFPPVESSYFIFFLVLQPGYTADANLTREEREPSYELMDGDFRLLDHVD